MTRDRESPAELMRRRKVLREMLKNETDPNKRASIHGRISAITRKLKDHPDRAAVRRARVDNLSADVKHTIKQAFNPNSPARQALSRHIDNVITGIISGIINPTPPPPPPPGGGPPPPHRASPLSRALALAGCTAFVLASVAAGDPGVFFYTEDILKNLGSGFKLAFTGTASGSDSSGDQLISILRQVSDVFKNPSITFSEDVLLNAVRFRDLDLREDVA